jgi:hypothetical protein
MSAARPCGGGPFRRDRGCAPVIQTRTANLTLYPKVNVLVIGPDALERLTAEQRDLLRQAADDVRELAIRDLPDETGGCRCLLRLRRWRRSHHRRRAR